MDKSLIQKLRKKSTFKDGKEYRGQLCGILLAFVDPRPEMGARRVLIGYSKCHPYLDRFDKDEMYRMATDRAFTLDFRLKNWKDRAVMTQDIYVTWEITGQKPATWPSDALKALPGFLIRCKKYYKDKTLTPWAQSLLDELGVEV